MLNRDFKEFIASLNESEVRYLVVGGYALAFLGHPRYTKDLDVWIWSDSSNAERVVAALAAFGFESLGLSADDFREPDQVIQLGDPPNRIDLLTSTRVSVLRSAIPPGPRSTLGESRSTSSISKALSATRRLLGGSRI